MSFWGQSFWGQPAHAIALVELLETGGLTRRRAQRRGIAELLDLGWAIRATRADRLELEPTARADIEATLDGVWPKWRAIRQALADRGLPYTLVGLDALDRQERADDIRDQQLPERLNLRTATVLVGKHSKAGLGPFAGDVFDKTELTHDGMVRLRPNVGLRICRGDKSLSAAQCVHLLGEVTLTDRAIRTGSYLSGTRPRAVLTIENLGAYQDAPLPDDVLALYIAGWNSRTARALLEPWPDVPIVHFGDLDPNGIAIVQHLRRWRSDVRWLIPDYWQGLGTRIPRTWPALEWPADTPVWVRGLAAEGVWLEQEVVVLHSGWSEALQVELSRAKRGQFTRTLV